MTDEQINVAIANATNCAGHGNYTQDLNAMHEAEKTLTQDQSEIFYPRWLGGFMSRTGPIYATARQRAQAFLRTIGKWEGD
jgi:hypothetical protein